MLAPSCGVLGEYLSLYEVGKLRLVFYLSVIPCIVFVFCFSAVPVVYDVSYD